MKYMQTETCYAHYKITSAETIYFSIKLGIQSLKQRIEFMHYIYMKCNIGQDRKKVGRNI
jgi:hypothetical protein